MKKLHGEMLREALRQNLKKFRKEAHFSQEQIAQQLGVNRATYTYYETGRNEPSVRSLYIIARFLGVPMEYLADDDYTPFGAEEFLESRNSRCKMKKEP